MLNGLDLFSGIGGLSLALNEWVRPIAYCEIDSYCQGVLLSKMDRSEITHAPIWDDVRTLNGESGNFPSDVIDIIYGGFPCQDISVAGRGKGLEGERSGLFFEIVRLAKEIKPKFIFLENVPAITSRGGIAVTRAITEMGYDCRWCVISAASVGALHRRERWFLLAHSCSETLQGFGTRSVISCEKNSLSSSSSHDGNTDSFSSRQADPATFTKQTEERTRRGSARQHWPFESREHWQEVVSGVCRTSDGVSFQVERLRSLGNAVVPIQARQAFKILMGIA